MAVDIPNERKPKKARTPGSEHTLPLYEALGVAAEKTHQQFVRIMTQLLPEIRSIDAEWSEIAATAGLASMTETGDAEIRSDVMMLHSRIATAQNSIRDIQSRLLDLGQHLRLTASDVEVAKNRLKG